MEEMKKVSIVMCTYNGERFLREQLDSLVNQTYPVYELIIQDDRSTDSTISILKEYKLKYSSINIQIYVNSQQLGFNRNFLHAYQKATGDLIASCDQDDIWDLSKIETLVNEMAGYTFIFHNSVMFNESKEWGPLFSKNIGEYTHPIVSLFIPRSLGHQLMFEREVLTLLKLFECYDLSYDYLLNTLCGCFGRIKYINKPLVRWRRHRTASTYLDKSGSNNKIYGYYKAICSLFSHSNRETTQKYFVLYAQLEFPHKEINELIKYMGEGSFVGIIKSCMICVKFRKLLVNNRSNVIQVIRSFFIPLFFIRDYGCYILKV